MILKQLRFFLYQSILFSTMLIMNYYFFDKYISKPFTHIDLIATVVLLIILKLALKWKWIDKFYEPFKSIRYKNKILLSIPAFILATIILIILTEVIALIFGR